MGTVFYVVIEHRNHMNIMSPTAVHVVDNRLSYDFRWSDSYVVGLGFGQKQLPTGEWLMFAADTDQFNMPSAVIDGLDKNSWVEGNGTFDNYCPSDLNFDGDVNGNDKSFWYENHGIYSQVPK